MLRETEFAYAPNEALSLRRHPIFDSPAPASSASTEGGRQEDDTISTPTSITGICQLSAGRMSYCSHQISHDLV